MEGMKQEDFSSPSSPPSMICSASSLSLTSELFGSGETNPAASSSTDIFGSIVGPPSNNDMVVGEQFMCSEIEKKQEFSTEPWCDGSGTAADDTTKSSEFGCETDRSWELLAIYQEERSQQPCHLSSSIYYGGQENYCHPQTAHCPNSPTKKDPTEDDSETASRGNWWQGSLYY